MIVKIKPDKKYSYWEYVYTTVGRTAGEDEVIRWSGDTLLKNKFLFKNPKKGFFNECRPGWYYSYISYVNSGRIDYITDEQDLRKFIGKIDNLEEALLISKIKKVWFDPNEMRAGSYRKTESGWELNMMTSEDCPVSRESMNVLTDTLGNFKSKSTGVYYESKDCIMY